MQLNYTTTEKELLSIVENIKYFRNILLGYKIEVFTDHKNPTYETIESASKCIQLWKNLMQEFVMILLYIKGETNVVANGFSRIPMENHNHKLADTTLEEDTCEVMCQDLLLISDNKY